MASPFPGMDPYLESPVHWQDFHATFVPVLREAISDRLPEDYFARIEEEVVMVEPETPQRRARADVLVGRDPLRAGGGKGGARSGAATMELEPLTLRNVVNLDPHVESHIQIVRLPGREVVTLVELLSPRNKAGEGWGMYYDKRYQLLMRGINLVEMDLLRGGRRVELEDPLPEAHYHALISRIDRRPECQVYSWSVRQRLPMLPIPLKPPDPDIYVDVQEAFGVAYQRGRYERMIDYASEPPPPPFEAGEAEWVRVRAASVNRSGTR